MKFYKTQVMPAIEILKLLQELTRNNIMQMKLNNDERDKLSVDQDISTQNPVLLKQYYTRNNQRLYSSEYCNLNSL